jgi:hypothetical protein
VGLVAGLVIALTACEGTNSQDPPVAQLPTATAPIGRWVENARSQHDPYLAGAGDIDQRLRHEGITKVGPDLCQAMFQLSTDDKLVEVAQRRSAEETGADLTSDQAVRLVVLTNDLICPDLER